MFKNLRKRTEGFTIIEVLIVLAIAGLIMLIVFLAVPALQRNQRNTARNSDATRWAAAVTECLANRNGTTTSCDADAELEQGTLSQLTNFGAANTTGVRLTYNDACQPDGSAGGAAAPSVRSFTITYQLEPNIPRCIAG